MEITFNIPALDRLCTILEDRTRTEVLEELKDEIIAQLKTAAQSRGQTAPEPRKGPQEPPKPEPTNVAFMPAAPAPEPAPKPEPRPKPSVTLGAIQKAAGALRDAGKIQDVTALFPEFGIEKLSALKPDQLDAFAERLREMGATL